MSLEHMRRTCGWHSRLLCRAVLPDYEIGLDTRGYVNIRKQHKAEVWGILFEIDEDGLSMLDKFEGYPDVFNRTEVVVYDDNNIKYKTQVYLEPENEFGGTEAREEFFRRVLGAAHENHLPEKWIKKLEGFLFGNKK